MRQIQTLSLDIETYSDVDLTKSGVYKYAESNNFEILLLAYSINNSDVEVIDIARGEKIPDEIISAILDDDVIKWAFNANFERVCLSSYLNKKYLNPKSWRCTMVWSAYMGLALSLAGVGKVLGLNEQKLKEGKELIRYFSLPCTPTKANGGRTRNLPCDEKDKWELFKAYNKRDVEVEIAIQKRLRNFPAPEFIWEEYHLDQEINDRGIRLDMDFVNRAIALDDKVKDELITELKKITHLENPNSVGQMKAWLEDRGLKLDSLGKNAVSDLMENVKEPIKTVLELRQKIAKSSIKKYHAMQKAVCSDFRARGMFMFYGANRTGRFSGRLIQLQNLTRNYITDIKEARLLVKEGNFDFIETLYDDIPDTLSQLVRTAFVPKEGYKFIVADFSAIEARVLSWLAGEKWRIEAFSKGEDIYCMSASKMYGVKVEKHGENAHLRQKGKLSELSCGYGGSVGAMKKMTGSKNTLSDNELQEMVNNWRLANPHIVKYWWDVDRAVKKAVNTKCKVEVGDIEFLCKSGMLFIKLPSGRVLSYVKPRTSFNRFGSECITYEGIGATKKWERIESYGPKFVENIVQAISRDLLMYAMLNLRDYEIVAHVHDEIIIECTKDVTVTSICKKMSQSPAWAKELKLSADGYECEFYMKD